MGLAVPRVILTGVTLELVPGHVDAGTARILQDQRPAHDRPWTQPVHDSGAWRVHWGGEAGSHGLRGGRDPGGGTGQESHKQMSGGGNQEQEGRGG